jgi:hypothetical protein
VLNQPQQSGITPGEVTANAPNITAQQAHDLADNTDRGFLLSLNLEITFTSERSP